MSDCSNHRKIPIKHIKMTDTNSQIVFDREVDCWFCPKCQRLYDKDQVIEIARIAFEKKVKIRADSGEAGTQ